MQSSRNTRVVIDWFYCCDDQCSEEASTVDERVFRAGKQERFDVEIAEKGIRRVNCENGESKAGN